MLVNQSLPLRGFRIHARLQAIQFGRHFVPQRSFALMKKQKNNQSQKCDWLGLLG